MSSLHRFLCRFLLGNTGSAEYSHELIKVSFVARPLIDRPLRLRHRNLGAPGFIPRGWILDRKLGEQRLLIGTREALHQMELLAGSPESSQVGEIRSVHHQRIAFPMAH